MRETLVYHGGYYGMEKDEAEERADQMIDVFDLRAKRDVRAPKLSGGHAPPPAARPRAAARARGW